MKKKAVVFDLDGTLINSLPDISRAMNKALAAHGRPTHEENAYKRFVGDGVYNLSLRALGEGHQQHADAVREAYSQEYAANSRVHTHPYAGIPEMLKALNEAGMQLCVLSNKDHADTLVVVAHYFPGIRFAQVRGRVDGVGIKPDPTALHLIAEALSLAPEDFWYVGDTQTDMRCGAAAGMERVAVLWGFQSREDLATQQPEHFVNTAEELTALWLSYGKAIARKEIAWPDNHEQKYPFTPSWWQPYCWWAVLCTS